MPTGFSLRSMDVPALLSLRAQIDETLAKRRKDLEQQLVELERANASGKGGGGVRRGRGGNGRGKSLKGIKVPPKYRDRDSGLTWAGRGAQPTWLRAALKGGAKLEDFLIDKVAAAKKPEASKTSPRKQKAA